MMVALKLCWDDFKSPCCLENPWDCHTSTENFLHFQHPFFVKQGFLQWQQPKSYGVDWTQGTLCRGHCLPSLPGGTSWWQENKFRDPTDSALWCTMQLFHYISQCNNNRNKMHNTYSALKASWNYSSPLSMKRMSSMKLVPGGTQNSMIKKSTRKLETAALDDLLQRRTLSDTS